MFTETINKKRNTWVQDMGKDIKRGTSSENVKGVNFYNVVRVATMGNRVHELLL